MDAADKLAARAMNSGHFNRVSATIRNSASALNTVSLDNADGPWRKKGGGVLSRVPSGMAAYCLLSLRRIGKPSHLLQMAPRLGAVGPASAAGPIAAWHCCGPHGGIAANPAIRW